MKNKDIFTFRDAEKQAGPVAFSTMLKPAGSACNLDCHYCYYLDKAVQYGGRQAVMSDELLELYVKQYIEANEVPTVQFCWHGGEPLLLGVDFYRKAMDFQQKYADGKKIENILQTNGTLVDEAWCDLFAGNNFLVGISLDGPQDIHDAFRLTKGGRPTFERVMRTIEMFQRSGVEYNTLSVVNRLCEGRGGEIYRFFRDTVHSRYMQFLPAVEHVVDKPGFHRPLIVSPDREGARLAEWSVTAKGYGEFLCDVFDVWVVSDVGRTFVQMFDATLAQWCGVPRASARWARRAATRWSSSTTATSIRATTSSIPNTSWATSAKRRCRRSTVRANGWISALPSAMRCPPNACGANTISPAGANVRNTASRPVPTAAARTRSARDCSIGSAIRNPTWSTCATCWRASSPRRGSCPSPASAWG